jgi:AcrR family transcriptional regulator
MATTSGIRARVRSELIHEIKTEARRQLALEGAPALSLRSVARELGMVSSAIYRYFASRDLLFTALIIDAYNELGQHVEEADANCDPSNFVRRWTRSSEAVRGWALQHPHEYSLIYGSPIPGYRAPADTVGPASRIILVFAGIVRDAAAANALVAPYAKERTPKLSKAAAADAARLEVLALHGVAPDAIVRSLIAWTQLFGVVNFDVFGRINDIVEDVDAFFLHSVQEMVRFIGFVDTKKPPRAPKAKLDL